MPTRSEVLLPSEVYAAAALQQCANEFAAHCRVTLQTQSDLVLLTIDSHADEPQLQREFLNRALDLSAQIHARSDG
jgi:hypothetical protein